MTKTIPSTREEGSDFSGLPKILIPAGIGNCPLFQSQHPRALVARAIRQLDVSKWSNRKLERCVAMISKQKEPKRDSPNWILRQRYREVLAFRWNSKIVIRDEPPANFTV